MKKYLLTIWSQNPNYYFLIEHLIKYLLKKKSKITLIYQGNKNFNSNMLNIKSLNEKQINHSDFNILNKFYFFYYIFLLLFTTLFKKPDVIIIYNNYPILLIKLISKFFKGRIIYHNFDYNPYPETLFGKFINFVEKKTINLFDVVVFSNQKRANILSKKLKIKKLSVTFLNNVLPLKFYKYFSSLKKKKNIKIIKIFRIGSIGPGHGIISILNCLKYLPNYYKLTLCGKVVDEDYYNKLRQIIVKNKILNRVTILTSANKKEWEKKLSNSDVGVALYENINFSHKYMVGASQKLNCYLAAGLPAIVYNDKQFNEFQKKNKCCIIVDSKNPKKMAKMIFNKTNNKKQLSNLKKNSILTFKKKYNFEIEIKKILKYL